MKVYQLIGKLHTFNQMAEVVMDDDELAGSYSIDMVIGAIRTVDPDDDDYLEADDPQAADFVHLLTNPYQKDILLE